MAKSLCVVVLAVLALSRSAGIAQRGSPDEFSRKVQQLGADDHYLVPRNVRELIKLSPAAVVVEFGAPSPFRWVEDVSPSGKHLAWDAFVGYEAQVLDVVYNRAGRLAPPLLVGTKVELTKRVGRREAEEFFAQRFAVRAGDVCLLFLWHRPQADTWSILQWSFQFRRSRDVADVAEPVEVLPAEMTLMTGQWLGDSAITRAKDGRTVTRWVNLVEQVRLLGTAER